MLGALGIQLRGHQGADRARTHIRPSRPQAVVSEGGKDVSVMGEEQGRDRVPWEGHLMETSGRRTGDTFKKRRNLT